MRLTAFLLVTAVIVLDLGVLSACGPSSTPVAPATTLAPVLSPPAEEQTPAPTGRPVESPSAAPPPSAAPSPQPVLPSAVLEPAETLPPPAIEVRSQFGEMYEVLFTIPVGEGGVRYLEGEPRSGPNALAVLADGTFAIADPVANRILLYDRAGGQVGNINPLAVNIHLLTDMTALGDDLLILEVGFGPMPERNHIYRLTRAGALASVYDLPTWATLENGLVGMEAGAEGQVLVWMKGGTELYQIADAMGAPYATLLEGVPQGGKFYWARGASGQAGEVAFETRLTEGSGGLRILGVNADGSFFVVREDAVMEGSTVKVDQTVHYLSARGEQLGVARVPLEEAFFYVPRSLAVAPDGVVYGLLPRPSAVDIVRLNFYTSVPAFLPGAAEPLVAASAGSP